MSAEFFELKLSGLVQETHDSRSFIFDIPEELREKFTYQAGQFFTFEIPWEGFSIRRCYSLASAPESDAWHKVTVKRVEDGRMSNWLCDNLNVGDTIKVQPPEGRFILKPESVNRPLTLFGGGSGITPVISLMKSALLSTKRNVKLVYANRDKDSIIFKRELDLLDRYFPARAEVVHHLDSDGGYMTVEKVKEMVAGRESGEFYVCGPGPFMDTVEAGFKESGLDGQHTHFERFVSPLDADRREDVAPVEVDPNAVPKQFVMHLDGNTHTVPLEAGVNLLAAAEAIGIKPPSSCEDGYCGCCMAMLKKGKVAMGAREALTDEDVQKGWILPCQALPTSAEELEIDYDATY